MAFIGFERIAASPSHWMLDESMRRQLRKVPWIVTEKIHGANFCFVIDASGVRRAKRKALLDDGEDFYDSQTVCERATPALRHVFKIVLSEQPLTKQVFVYGELFGGGYPHPEVPPDPRVRPIQTGVWYSPSIVFSAFDIATETGEGESSHYYMDFERALEIFAEAGLFAVEPLLVGTMEEAMAYPVGFGSTVPARLGLPPLAEPNKAEGIVLRPARTIIVPTRKGLARPLLKIKIPAFSEDRRYHGAVAWEAPPRPDAGDALAILEWEMLARVNPNRLDSALSKSGRIDPSDAAGRAALQEAVVHDVLVDLEEGFSEQLAAVEGADRDLLVSVLSDEVAALIEARLGGATSPG